MKRSNSRFEGGNLVRNAAALIGVALLGGCTSGHPTPVATEPLDVATSAADRPARAVLDEINQRFAAPAHPSARLAPTVLTEPFDRKATRRFAATGEGGLRLVSSGAGAHRGTALRGSGERVEAIFAAQAGDGVHVSLAGRPDAWLKVRPVGAGASARAVVDGHVVYPKMRPGVDAIYVASDERVEEYLHLRSAEAASSLVFDVELGKGIATLRSDASGAGLEAIDTDGRVALRAPMPEGVDAHGQPVRGRLTAASSHDGRWAIRVELTGAAPAWPVLLDPSWAPTGSMAAARRDHTETLLPSGKVLITGGFDNAGQSLASCELYDPAAGTFSATGAMGDIRGGHSATLLGSGKVLVAGGYNAAAATAELYDPASGTFAPTGPLVTPRILQSATLLPSGKVLLACGDAANGAYLASAELYDPALGTFSATGSSTIARNGHTATLLPSGPSAGKVLIVGGNAALLGLTNAELYDPATGVFSLTGPMGTARAVQTATLLTTGKVLIAGGFSAPLGFITPSAELYDPATGTFSPTGSLTDARESHTATRLPSGKVLLAGGRPVGFGTLASAELYDPVAGSFSVTAPLTVPRNQHTATLLPSGKVLVAGGDNFQPYVLYASAELYDALTSCPAGSFDCDGNAGNGCEVSQGVSNCGGCGVAGPNNAFICSSNHIAAPSCSGGGVCGGVCDVGWADCNSSKTVAGNGCETDLSALTVCGSCPAIGDITACGTPFCSVVGGCGADTDGDGLSDKWEMNGYIDINCNGVNDGAPIDVQLPGATATTPDVYVTYDWMDLPSTGEVCANTAACRAMGGLHIDETCVAGHCAGHSHDPEALAAGALDAVAARFTARGFRLHVLRGHVRPHARVVSFRVPAAACEGATVAAGDTANPAAVNLYDLKNLAPASLDANTRLVYHYLLFGHYSSCDNIADCSACPAVKGATPAFGQTGIAEISGNDSIVSLGNLVNDLAVPPNQFIVGGTFMHELGHNLGLRHGGGAENTPGYKPNYLSVMNYRYQLGGIQSANAIGSNTPNPALTRLDYAVQTLPTAGSTPTALDETQLNEPAGLGSGTADLFTFTDGSCTPRLRATNGAIDWDGDGDVAGLSVSADLNPQEDPSRNCGDVTNEVQTGHTDWGPGAGASSFTYAFQCNPLFADGVGPASAYAEIELPASQALATNTVFPPRAVDLDVRPGCGINWFVIGSPLAMPVAILGAADLDVSTIDVTSLRLNGAHAVSQAIVDVNLDGFGDLVANFVMARVSVAPGASEVHLSAVVGSGALKSQLLVGSGGIVIVASGNPGVSIKSDDYYVKDPDFRAIDEAAKTCSDPPFLRFKLSDCVASVTDACGAPLDVNTAGTITRIELWPTMEADDSHSPGKVSETLEEARERLDHAGCAKLTFAGSSATLPYKELEHDDDNTSFYKVFFSVRDGVGAITSTSCRVNLFESRHEQAEIALARPGEQPVPVGCAACTGAGCGACPLPAVACPKSTNTCQREAAKCQQKGNCTQFNRACTTQCQ